MSDNFIPTFVELGCSNSMWVDISLRYILLSAFARSGNGVVTKANYSLLAHLRVIGFAKPNNIINSLPAFCSRN